MRWLGNVPINKDRFVMKCKTCQAKSFFESCDVKGPRATTSKGTLCAHSVDCTRKRYAAGKEGHGPPGWALLRPDCMNPQRVSSTKKIPSKKKKASSKKKKVSSKKQKKVSNKKKQTTPRSPAASHNLRDLVIGRDNDTMYVVYNKKGSINDNGVQSKYKAYKRV